MTPKHREPAPHAGERKPPAERDIRDDDRDLSTGEGGTFKVPVEPDDLRKDD